MKAWIRSRKVIITCGTGGVGKTTLSAALGMRAADLGQKVCVVTMDPARRLKTALGLESLGHEPERIRRDNGAGEFWACTPDTRLTLEQMIRENASDPKVATKLINNPIFKILAQDYAGVQEYMALARLLRLVRDRRFDLIVVDTPPGRHAIQFLRAPALVMRFFEERLLRILLPSNKIIAKGIQKALGLMENLTGAGFMKYFFELAEGILAIQEKFVLSLHDTIQILRSPDTGFLLVTAPTLRTLEDILSMRDILEKHSFSFERIAINRSLGALKASPLEREIARKNPHFAEALSWLEGQRRIEANLMGEISRQFPHSKSFQIPELSRDIHSIEDLSHVARFFET